MKPGVDFVGLGVGALIVKDNKALMLLRTDNCRNNRGLWTIPGGMAEQPETIEAAVRREALEEAGVALSSVRFLSLSDRFFDDQHWVSALYLCTTNEEPTNNEPHMHSRLEWINIDRLPENVTLPSMDAINAYRNMERN